MTNALRKAMLSTICMLVVAVLSLTGATYAWFTIGTTASISGVNVTVESADGGIQVRTVDGSSKGKWVTTLPLSFTNVVDFKPLSSSDGTNFYKIKRDVLDNTIYTVKKATDQDTSAYVITQKLEFTNPGSSDQTIVLSANGSDIASSIGAIDEAVRVAFIVEGKEAVGTEGEDGYEAAVPAKTYIWAPYDGSYVALVGESTTAKDWANELPETEGNATVLETVTPDATEQIKIDLPANPTMEDDDEHVIEVTMVIWLEGQDSDCSNSNAGTSFEIGLKFDLFKE